MLWGFLDLIAIYCNAEQIERTMHSLSFVFSKQLICVWGTARNSMKCRCVCLGRSSVCPPCSPFTSFCFPALLVAYAFPAFCLQASPSLWAFASCVFFTCLPAELRGRLFWGCFRLVCPCPNGLFGCWCPSVPLTLAFYLSPPLTSRHPWSPCFLSLDLSKTGWSTTASGVKNWVKRWWTENPFVFLVFVFGLNQK